jgi:predicted ATP-grasp superfamily ATP-dependent carboligase
VVSNSLHNSQVSQLPVESEELTHRNQHPVTHVAPYDALVLDAWQRQSLVTVRSLGRRGLHVAALETFKGVPAFSSRWCQQAFYAPSYEQSIEPYLAYVEQLLDQNGARVLITTSDGTMALIRRYRAQLERRVHIALAKEPALGIAINKDQTLEVAKQLGLGIPRGVNVGSVNEVSVALDEVGLPAVVKPVESWLWGDHQSARLACRLVTTPDEARRAVEALTRLGGAVLFQQFLSGRREAVSFLYAYGEMYARFAQWAKRTEPPLGGTSVLRQSITIPEDIGTQAECLVREIELEGYSEVEFRRDSDGKPYLMEINPRLSASVEIAVRAGVDFPYLLYQWANEDSIDRVQGYSVGGWMRYLGGDIMTTVRALIEHGRPGVSPPAQALFDFCIAFFQPMGYDYLDWKDLLPACTATGDFVRFLLKRLRSPLARMWSQRQAAQTK